MRVARPRVVTSPLRRCRETAEVIAAPWGMTVDDEPGLIEMDYGEWDERPLADLPRDVWESWQRDPDFAPPGGETLRAVQDACRRAWQRCCPASRRKGT